MDIAIAKQAQLKLRLLEIGPLTRLAWQRRRYHRRKQKSIAEQRGWSMPYTTARTQRQHFFRSAGTIQSSVRRLSLSSSLRAGDADAASYGPNLSSAHTAMQQRDDVTKQYAKYSERHQTMSSETLILDGWPKNSRWDNRQQNQQEKLNCICPRSDNLLLNQLIRVYEYRTDDLRDDIAIFQADSFSGFGPLNAKQERWVNYLDVNLVALL